MLEYASDAAALPSRAAGVAWPVAAGIAVGALSILLMAICARGGQLARAFATLRGNAIALALVIGRLVLRDAPDEALLIAATGQPAERGVVRPATVRRTLPSLVREALIALPPLRNRGSR